ncbi:XRE family transcriptional regulator [Buchananella hordeovulneris]|nr:XRE family transcriptional regulator [Buchananella hordeovulneris]
MDAAATLAAALAEGWGGPILHARRVALGVSQRDMAEPLGVRRLTLSEIETGRRTPGQRLANALATLVTTWEALQDAAVVELCQQPPGDQGRAVLWTYRTAEAYWDADQQAAHLQVPAAVHQVAAGRAWRSLAEAGVLAEILHR